MVGAWAASNRISLGQVVVDGEIAAIPKLLRMLKPYGCLLAMGCQDREGQLRLGSEGELAHAARRHSSVLWGCDRS